ncbi:MAG: biotin-dependent carboxyltransferase family protein [Pseudomonadota bacterium]
MADAVLSVSFAGPLVSIQDGGRTGHMRYGVSASGPMDRLSFDAANAALGNPQGHAGIEVSLGGVILKCESGPVSLAIAGGAFLVDYNGISCGSWTIITLRKGDRLTIRAGASGSWAYIAMSGGLQVDPWLNSKATHTISGFGGGALRAGQKLVLHDAVVREDREGEIAKPNLHATSALSVVMGPQDARFTNAAVRQFTNATFKVTDAYDRMGMRLSGPGLALHSALSIPSEPIVRGSVQVSGDGVPTILLADHQTTGGYPKIATVVSVELDRLVQMRSGEMLRFRSVTAEDAIAQTRQYAAQKSAYLSKVAIPRGTFAQRLMRENLVHGFLPD